ncbi:MAG: hypothetical protein ABT940_06055 [Alphaproteobacteria bacterium]
MSTATFDKLIYLETLKASGIPEARAHAHALDEAMRDAVATKGDITALRADMETRIAELKFDLLKWIVGLALAQMGLLVGLLIKLH